MRCPDFSCPTPKARAPFSWSQWEEALNGWPSASPHLLGREFFRSCWSRILRVDAREKWLAVAKPPGGAALGSVFGIVGTALCFVYVVRDAHTGVHSSRWRRCCFNIRP